MQQFVLCNSWWLGPRSGTRTRGSSVEPLCTNVASGLEVLPCMHITPLTWGQETGTIVLGGYDTCTGSTNILPGTKVQVGGVIGSLVTRPWLRVLKGAVPRRTQVVHVVTTYCSGRSHSNTQTHHHHSQLRRGEPLLVTHTIYILYMEAARQDQAKQCSRHRHLHSWRSRPKMQSATRPYPSWMVGGKIETLHWSDPAVQDRLQRGVPIILSGGCPLSKDLIGHWTWSYLSHALGPYDGHSVQFAPRSYGQFTRYYGEVRFRFRNLCPNMLHSVAARRCRRILLPHC